MRRILTIILKDLRNGTRDQITSYLLVAPILLGLLAALVIPLLSESTVVFAVSADLPSEQLQVLEAHGHVETFTDRAAVVERVMRRDDIPGVVAGAHGQPEVIVQGNEPDELSALPGVILDHAARVHQDGSVDQSSRTPVDTSSGSTIGLIITAMLAYSVVVMMGLALGLTILEEKQTGTITVAVASPLRFVEYLVAKLVVGTVLSAVLVLPVVVIVLGSTVSFGGLMAVAVASVPFAVSFGLWVGVYAKDQLGAVAVMKVLSPLWTSLPILGFVLPERWMWTMWPFANHWGTQAFYAVLEGEPAAVQAGLAVAVGLPVLVMTAWFLRRRLGFG